MALTLGAFYENNLETLSADLENVTVISFEIQAVQSVDINNRNTTVYIGKFPAIILVKSLFLLNS